MKKLKIFYSLGVVRDKRIWGIQETQGVQMVPSYSLGKFCDRLWMAVGKVPPEAERVSDSSQKVGCLFTGALEGFARHTDTHTKF